MSSARVPAFAAALRQRVKGQVLEAEPLVRYTTYRIGGPATVLVPAVPEDVGVALAFATARDVPWFALGLGSNVLIADAGLDALVIRLGKGLDRLEASGDRWRFGAGLPAPLAARRTAQAGWAGIHMMVGVPGTIGGGIFMNAGCHGGQWSDTVETVLAVDGQGRSQVFPRAEIPFQYRHSGLDGWIVLETAVRLTPGDPEQLKAEVTRLFDWRQRGTPFNQPCCGSVFKNPDRVVDGVKRTAGQWIDGAGLKGLRVGGAEVSSLHANYVVNTGGATAADVRQLIDEVRAEVLARFGIPLETEVKWVE